MALARFKRRNELPNVTLANFSVEVLSAVLQRNQSSGFDPYYKKKGSVSLTRLNFELTGWPAGSLMSR